MGFASRNFRTVTTLFEGRRGALVSAALRLSLECTRISSRAAIATTAIATAVIETTAAPVCNGSPVYQAAARFVLSHHLNGGHKAQIGIFQIRT